jgi:hypothetical protein
MEGVKRDSYRKQNVEMRRVINDADSFQEPLKIFEQKISVFEKTEHAQIHANARDQPAASGVLISGFAHLAAQPKIHCGGPEQKRGERRVPRSVKNVTGHHEKIFPRLPRTDTPVKGDNDYEENDESEGIKKHAGRNTVESTARFIRTMPSQMFRGSWTV